MRRLLGFGREWFAMSKRKLKAPSGLGHLLPPGFGADGRAAVTGQTKEAIMDTHVNVATDPETSPAHFEQDASHETPWQFEIGDMVTHESQPLPSMVLDRQRCRNAKGKTIDLYGVRSFANFDAHRDRLIMGDSLKPIDQAAWEICLLRDTGMVDAPVFA
jgi:hypothetical protein